MKCRKGDLPHIMWTHPEPWNNFHSGLYHPNLVTVAMFIHVTVWDRSIPFSFITFCRYFECSSASPESLFHNNPPWSWCGWINAEHTSLTCLKKNLELWIGKKRKGVNGSHLVMVAEKKNPRIKAANQMVRVNNNTLFLRCFTPKSKC